MNAATTPATKPAAPMLALEHFLPYRLSVLSQLVSTSIHDRYFQPSGLTIPQWRVMAILGRFAPVSASEVCDRTLLDKVTVSRAIAALRQRRLVQRTVDPGDRRRSALGLTPEGQRLHQQIAALALDYERRLLQGLTSAERTALDRLLQKLTGHARAMRMPTSARQPRHPDT
ncbi:MAG: MarR family transcriptional regulator [Alphaproteobacteria bacterium]|nr:MarR family transcriptional regulator [Alphaproteobacteria bacterium]